MVGDLEGHVRVLLDEKDGRAVLVELADDPEDVLHDEGGESEGRLVHQEELGPGHEGAGDGEHLLLTAREGAGVLGRAFPEHRKAREHRLHVLIDPGGVVPGECARSQVLLHRHVREHEPVLGHQGDALLDDVAGCPPADLVPAEGDGAPPGFENPGNGHHQGGLAGPVRAEEAGDIAVRGGEVHSLERLDVPVGSRDVVHLEEGLAHDAAPPADPAPLPPLPVSEPCSPASSERPR